MLDFESDKKEIIENTQTLEPVIESQSDSAATRGNTRRWGLKLDVRKKAVAVFSAASAGFYLLLAMNGLSTRWEGTSMNYILTVDIVPALICGAIAAVMYYSYAR